MRGLFMFVLVSGLAGLVMLFAGCSGSGDCGVTPSLKIELSVPFPPQVVPSPEWQNMAYEIDMSEDLRTLGFTLDRLDVLDGADGTSIVTTYRCETLAEQLMYLAPTGGGPAIAALPIWLHFEHGKPVPASLLHRFRFVRISDGAAVTLTGARTTIDTTPVRVIAPPLKGAGLGAFEIGEATTHHFRSLVLSGKVTKSPQRWASDWSLFNSDRRLYSGNGKANTDYAGWGTNYYAVADGTVVEVLDQMPDQKCWPGKITDPDIIANPSGNHVVVDIGQGQFAVYGHCQRNSVAVKVGDRVTTGQVIAKMGNTGMSDCPHLHFQLSNSADVFNAESVPYVIDSYLYIGKADFAAVMSFQGAYTAFDAGVNITNRIFDQGSVVTMGQ